MHTNIPENINDNADVTVRSYVSDVYRKMDSANKEEIKSTLISKNITVLGRRTSIRLEPEMWRALKEISRREKCSIHDVCSMVYLCKKPLSSLTASIRVFLMLYYKAAATEDGHKKASHGNLESIRKRLLA